MSDNSMSHQNKKTVKRALILSAPFFLTALAIILFTVFFFVGVLENNTLYSILTKSPERLRSGMEDSRYIDPADYDLLKQQAIDQYDDTGMYIPSEFPPIYLGEQWATITIENAQVYDVPVYHGQTEDLLLRGIGHYENSRFPGQNGKVVLPGHVGIYQHFQRLEKMQIGDIVELKTTYGDYVYKVTATEIYEATDKKLINLLLPDFTEDGQYADGKADTLICYTCYPFNTTAVRTQRFVIICEKVSGYDFINKVME